MLGSVVGATLFGIAVNQTRDNAGALRVRFAGAAPNVGEFHYALPSDRLLVATRNGNFVIHIEVSPEDRAETCEKLVAEFTGLDLAYASGRRAGHARWVPGCPGRAACGGVGGNRLLLLTPEPVTWELWSAVMADLRNVNLASLEKVDGLDDPLESLPQRAKRKSVGGQMAVYASKNSPQCAFRPMWPTSTARARKMGPLVDGRVVAVE